MMAASTAAWNAEQYLRFEDERTRAARDLLARVPRGPRVRGVDLGCGPGNSTELLIERFPAADISGVDSSPQMLAQARERLPALRFEQADLSSYQPPQGTDLLFANAVFQWVPEHLDVLARLLAGLPDGGVLAVQMPDNLSEPSHRLMREVARGQPFSSKLTEAVAMRAPLPPAEVYYDRLRPLCRSLDIWHTAYNHPLAGAQAIVEWVKGTGLRPFLAPLDAAERAAFLDDYRQALEVAYPARVDGTSLLRFPRFFLVAMR